MKKRKRAVIITTRGFQDNEFIYPFYRLKEAGFRVDVATTEKKEFFGYYGIRAVPTMTTKELKGKVRQFDLVLLPGGAKALEYIRQDRDAIKFIAAMHKAGKVVAAICHGTQLLISAGILKGKRASGYYSIADDVRNAGGTYVNEPVVVDGNLVTSPHYDYMGDFMRETLKKCGVR